MTQRKTVTLGYKRRKRRLLKDTLFGIGILKQPLKRKVSDTQHKTSNIFFIALLFIS